MSAARSIEEALVNGIERAPNAGNGTDGLIKSLRGEVRDYIAHEVMKFEMGITDEYDESLLNRFFKKIMGESI